MGELLTKIFAVFALIVFITILINHGQIDFSLWDKTTEKANEAIHSEEGQQLITEVKDTSFDVGTTFLQKFRKDAIKAALTEVSFVRVVDGDTIIVHEENGTDMYVRMIGIDTPESVNPDEEKNTYYGKLASDYTKALLDHQDKVYLQFDKDNLDQYNRLLAYVWIKNDVDTSKVSDIEEYMINGILLRRGYAINKTYEPNTRYENAFKEIRQKAQAEGSGLWADSEFANTWN